MEISKIKFIIVGGVATIVVFFVLIFQGVIPGLQKEEININKGVEGTLTIWGMYDDAGALKGAIDAFKVVYPNLKVEYQKFTDYNRYEGELLEALATQKGPDIFMIPNRGLSRNREKIMFAPQNQISLLSFQRLFPRVVEEDFVDGGQIGALPLYIDTLALVYNRNMLNQAGIVYPPATWEELETMAPRVKVALGGSPDTIARASDIVELLALQEAAKEGRVLAGNVTSDSAGTRALDFYKKFKYEETSYSLDAFGAGRVAMIFGYSSDIKNIQARTSFIEPIIAKIPQKNASENPITLANYWGYTVSNQSRMPDIAWQFIIMATTNEEIARAYSEAKGVPPALNSLIQASLNNPKMNVLAEQALIARSLKTPNEKRQKEEVEQTIRNAIKK